jgi:hypothetical protein
MGLKSFPGINPGFSKCNLNICDIMQDLRFFTAVTIKNAVFWDVAPYRSCVNRRFGGKYRLHFQDRKIRERGTSVSAATCSRWFLVRGFFCPEGGDTFLRNVRSHKIYTAPHPRRLHSSCVTLCFHYVT